MTDNEIRNAVIEMAERKESVGLAFLGGGYKLDGVGTCADRILKIPVKVGFNKVGRIRSGAFGNCDFLEEILIPACVDSVADGAFDGCVNLKRVHILGKDTNFEGNAFINCPSIEDVFFYGNRTEWERFCDWKLELYPRNSDDLFCLLDKHGNENLLKANVHCCCRKYLPAEKDTDRPLTEKEIRQAVIGAACQSDSEDLAFDKGMRSLSGTYFSYDLASIGRCADVSLKIPGSYNGHAVLRIGRALSGCRHLKEIVVPEGIGRIDPHAFDGCDGLERIFLPKSLSAIGPYAFAGCTALKNVFFAGKERQWKKMREKTQLDSENVGSTFTETVTPIPGNEALDRAEIHFDCAKYLANERHLSPAGFIRATKEETLAFLSYLMQTRHPKTDDCVFYTPFCRVVDERENAARLLSMIRSMSCPEDAYRAAANLLSNTAFYQKNVYFCEDLAEYLNDYGYDGDLIADDLYKGKCDAFAGSTLDHDQGELAKWMRSVKYLARRSSLFEIFYTEYRNFLHQYA